MMLTRGEFEAACYRYVTDRRPSELDRVSDHDQAMRELVRDRAEQRERDYEHQA